MPDDDSKSVAVGNAAGQNARTGTGQRRGFFDIPAPLKRIFDKFPLATYASNELPQRSPRHRTKTTLHVFTTDKDAEQDRPSFNPGCLKWQTYLKFCDIDFRTVPSNNHASPSGVLPYAQPAIKEAESGTEPGPIPSNKLKRWAAGQGGDKQDAEGLDERYDAYLALIDSRIRKAWLYQLYLAHQNAHVVDRLYIRPCSTEYLVRVMIAKQLRAAAEAELVKASKGTVVSVEDLMNDVDEALQALSIFLGDKQWFFTQQRPGLFDASLFAYTHLILDEGFQWEYNPMKELLQKHPNLQQHVERIRDLYF